jgi:diaminohydroxyphosphoribosylaminopyrimidine deaminase/5-amino-6-(5-phosphoribosylamino)uracil reductase
MKMPEKTWNSTDKAFLRQAIRAAERSRGLCSPNPFVGALIVKNGKVIAEGNTQPYGHDHAEIVALKKAGTEAKGATMYVTLEPCCHYGKTPPCTKSIIAAGIKRVVAGIADPNPLVSGKGFKELESAGIEVLFGGFETIIHQQIEYHTCYVENNRPFVIWKTALSWDGRYAAQDGSARWISNPASRRYTHKLRMQVEAVLAGVRSVMHDDAMLNVRLPKVVKQPLRVLLDPVLDISLDSAFACSASSFPSLIMYHDAPLSRIRALEKTGCELKQISGQGDCLDLNEVLNVLYERKLYSVLLETGNRLSEAFWQAHLIDKVMIFYGNKILGGDKSILQSAPVKNIEQAITLRDIRSKRLGDNILISGYPVYPE